MHETQLDQWVRLIRGLPNRIPGDFLTDEVAKISAAIQADGSGGRRKRKEFHPFAELYHRVGPHLARYGSPEFRPTPDLAKLGSLAFSIDRLEQSGVEGLNDRVARLSSSHWTDFESVRFELEVAAMHVVMSKDVGFIPEGYERRPDIELDGTIEIECKHKVELSDTDLAMRNEWSLLERRLYAIFKGPGAFRVELMTRGLPVRRDIGWVQSNARRFLATGASDGDLQLEEQDRSLTIRRLHFQEDRNGGVVLNEPAGSRGLETFDHGKMEITAQVANGTMQPWLALQFGFETGFEKDWLSGVRNSIRSARKQLSASRPGIVFVEVPAAARTAIGDGLGPLKVLVEKELRNSGRISAIAIAFTGWDAAKGVALAEYHVERNPRARLPLPDGYYVSSDIRAQWRKTIRRNEPCPCGSGQKFKRCCS